MLARLVALLMVAALAPLVPGGAASSVWSFTPPSAQSGAADPVAGSGYLGVGPTRIADTRKPAGPANGLSGAFGPGEVRDLPVVGAAGVPADATAVVLNVTVTGASAPSDLRVWPAGEPAPDASNLNWAAGRTVANLVVVGVGAGGAVSLRNQSGDAHVVVDVQGAYVPSGPRYQPVSPRRLLDTRATQSVAAGEVRDLPVAGVDDVPADATAVVVNLTVTGGTAASDLRAWPSGGAVPQVSNLNWPAGDTRANLAVVPIGDGGAISLRNQSGQVHVIVDVVGFVSPGGDDGYHPMAPVRLFDTRDPSGPLVGPFATGEVRSVEVSPLPADATAVVVNLTVTGGTAASDLRAWPSGGAVPQVSNLNWPAGDTRPNLAVVPIGDGGRIALRNQSGQVHVIGDVVGWFADDPIVDGGQWTDISDGLPNDDSVVLTTVSCATAEHCLAAGTALPGSPIPSTTVPGSPPPAGGPVVYELGVSGWAPVATPSPLPGSPGFDPSFVERLSCGSPSHCAALVRYSDGGGDTVLGVALWDGSGWSSPTPGPVYGDSDPIGEMGLECFADGSCVLAVDDGLIWSYVGGAWTSSDAVEDRVVDCASATGCLVQSGAGLAWWDGTVTPLAAPPPPAPSDERGHCDGSPSCLVTVGGTFAQGGRGWDGTAWTTTAATPGGFDTALPDYGTPVCVSVDECYAAGYWSNSLDGEERWYRWDGVAWRRMAEPGPLVRSRGDGRLGGVDCAPSTCVAVGVGVGPVPVARRYTSPVPPAVGGEWSEAGAGLPTSADESVELVSCTSATHCLGVGSRTTSGATDLMALEWDGATWTELPSPAAPWENYAESVEAVDCSSPSRCAVLVAYGTVDDEIVDALIWNGIDWARHQLTYQGLTGEVGVLCGETWGCVVSGDENWVWDGTTWTELSLFDVYAMTCLDAVTCLGLENVLEWEPRWIGATSITEIPELAAIGHLTPADAAVCAAVDDCTVVFAGSTFATVRWDGTDWTAPIAPPTGILAWARGTRSGWGPGRWLVDCAAPDDCHGLAETSLGDRWAAFDGSVWARAAFPGAASPTSWHDLDCTDGGCMVVGAGDGGSPTAAWYSPSSP